MNMIKNYENFVNEGFIDNVMSGIEAGIGAFKASRSADKAADRDLKIIKDGDDDEFSNEAQINMLVKQLVQRSALFADGFSWEKIADGDDEVIATVIYRMGRIEEVISKLKEMLTKTLDVKF